MDVTCEGRTCTVNSNEIPDMSLWDCPWQGVLHPYLNLTELNETEGRRRRQPLPVPGDPLPLRDGPDEVVDAGAGPPSTRCNCRRGSTRRRARASCRTRTSSARPTGGTRTSPSATTPASTPATRTTAARASARTTAAPPPPRLADVVGGGDVDADLQDVGERLHVLEEAGAQVPVRHDRRHHRAEPGVLDRLGALEGEHVPQRPLRCSATPGRAPQWTWTSTSPGSCSPRGCTSTFGASRRAPTRRPTATRTFAKGSSPRTAWSTSRRTASAGYGRRPAVDGLRDPVPGGPRGADGTGGAHGLRRRRPRLHGRVRAPRRRRALLRRQVVGALLRRRCATRLGRPQRPAGLSRPARVLLLLTSRSAPPAAGRTLNIFVVTATLASQSLDSLRALGNIDLGYKYHWWDGACLPLGLGLSLVLNGIFFAKPLNEMRLLTLPDLFARKFGPATEAPSSSRSSRSAASSAATSSAPARSSRSSSASTRSRGSGSRRRRSGCTLSRAASSPSRPPTASRRAGPHIPLPRPTPHIPHPTSPSHMPLADPHTTDGPQALVGWTGLVVAPAGS